jgi:hypothetical protein
VCHPFTYPYLAHDLVVSTRIKFNSLVNKESQDYEVTLVDENGNQHWEGHPDVNIDVGVVRTNLTILQKHQMEFDFFCSDKHPLKIDDLREAGISEGDLVYVLGFPLGLVSPERRYVICREGCIARIRDLLEQHSKDFLIDSFVFPGNSGGPVILRPEMSAVTGTKPIEKASLIGMVQAYIPFQDIAYSLQTNRPRVVFEQNSGLASVIPIDFISETIEICFEKTSRNNMGASQETRDENLS